MNRLRENPITATWVIGLLVLGALWQAGVFA